MIKTSGSVKLVKRPTTIVLTIAQYNSYGVLIQGRSIDATILDALWAKGLFYQKEVDAL